MNINYSLGVVTLLFSACNSFLLKNESTQLAAEGIEKLKNGSFTDSAPMTVINTERIFGTIQTFSKGQTKGVREILRFGDQRENEPEETKQNMRYRRSPQSKSSPLLRPHPGRASYEQELREGTQKLEHLNSDGGPDYQLGHRERIRKLERYPSDWDWHVAYEQLRREPEGVPRVEQSWAFERELREGIMIQDQLRKGESTGYEQKKNQQGYWNVHQLSSAEDILNEQRNRGMGVPRMDKTRSRGTPYELGHREGLREFENVHLGGERLIYEQGVRQGVREIQLFEKGRRDGLLAGQRIYEGHRQG